MKTIHYPNKIRSRLVTIVPMAPFSPKSTSNVRSALHFRYSIVIPHCVIDMLLLSTHSSLLIKGSPFLLPYGGSPPASPASHLASSIYRYRHNIIVLYGLHVINHILLFSVSYFTSFIHMVNVQMNYFSLSLIVIHSPH